MMFGLGEGIAFGALTFAGAQVAIVAIRQKSINNSKTVTSAVCEVKHEGIGRELSSINQKLNILIERNIRS